MFDEASLTSLVARHRTLNGFVEAVSEADGVGLTDVDALTILVVRTDNSVYQITILQGHTREVLGIGLHMEFHFVDQWMITSHVREIAIEPSATTRPCWLGVDQKEYERPVLSDRQSRRGVSMKAATRRPTRRPGTNGGSSCSTTRRRGRIRSRCAGCGTARRCNRRSGPGHDEAVRVYLSLECDVRRRTI